MLFGEEDWEKYWYWCNTEKVSLISELFRHLITESMLACRLANHLTANIWAYHNFHAPSSHAHDFVCHAHLLLSLQVHANEAGIHLTSIWIGQMQGAPIPCTFTYRFFIPNHMYLNLVGNSCQQKRSKVSCQLVIRLQALDILSWQKIWPWGQNKIVDLGDIEAKFYWMELAGLMSDFCRLDSTKIGMGLQCWPHWLWPFSWRFWY